MKSTYNLDGLDIRKWAHLPNAAAIEMVVESVKNYPNEWWGIVDSSDTELDHINQARRGIYVDTLLDDATDLELLTKLLGFPGPAWDAILVFITTADSTKYLDMTYSELVVWSKLSEAYDAFLMLRAVKVFERLNQKPVTPP